MPRRDLPLIENMRALARPSEDLCAFLVEQSVPTAYLHSDVKPMQRLELLRQLRAGEVDVLVGVNLLREVSPHAAFGVVTDPGGCLDMRWHA